MRAWQTVGVRVIFSPHHFGQLLTPDIAAQALAEGWAEAEPADEVLIHPHSDGSTGFLKAVPGITEILTVRDAGTAVPVSVVRKEHGGNPWHTVYCQGDGIDDPRELTAEDFQRTTSQIVGTLLSEIIARGARRVVISAGHAPWHDGGAGLLRALAHGLGVAPRELGSPGSVPPETAELIQPVRSALGNVEIIVASSRQVPLRGLHGAGAELADLPRITPQQAQDLEARTTHYVNAVDQVVKSNDLRGLLTVADVLASRRPFAGAGGGVAFILLALGAKVFPGARVIGEETGLSRVIDECDLAVTGAQIIAGEELGSGVVADVAARAGGLAIPVIAVGARIDASRGQLFKAGVNTAYQVIDTPSSRPQLVAPPTTEAALVARGRRLARTWSR